MGEYATRKSDNERIKIGTCEDMYYLRFEDRDKVSALEGNVDVNLNSHAGECRFRLPFPDEDHILPGEYEDYNRGQRLYRNNDDFSDSDLNSDLADKPGSMQISHKSGLLFSIPCHHGIKLPDLGTVKMHWNGKSWHLELSSLRAVEEDGQLHVYPVIVCRFCREAWRYNWDRVIDWVPEPLRGRLLPYAVESAKRELDKLKVTA